MNELTIRDNLAALPQLPDVVWNRDEVVANLGEMLAAYEGRQYTPGEIAAARADRAAIGKWEKQLTESRKAVSAFYAEPAKRFAAQVDDCVQMCEKVRTAIDKQIKAVEQAQREERRQALEKAYTDNAGGELLELVPFARVLDDRWLNKSTPESTARKELLVKIETIRAELENLRSVCGEDFPEAQRVYLRGLSVNEALAAYKQMQDTRAAQARAEAIRAAVERERASRQVVLPPTDEEREIRAAGRQQAQDNAHITADGRLDFSMDAKPRTFTRTMEVTYTAEQGRALADFMRAAGIIFKLK